MVFDPPNRRATKRTFISCVSKDTRRVVEDEKDSEIEEEKEYECEEKYIRVREQQGGPENSTTMRHMARARLDERVPATRDAVQLPAASSVGFSHEATHRAIGLFPCPPVPPYLIRQPIPVLRSRSTSLENALNVLFLSLPLSLPPSEPHTPSSPSSYRLPIS